MTAAPDVFADRRPPISWSLVQSSPRYLTVTSFCQMRPFFWTNNLPMSRVIGTLLPIFANFVIFPCYFFVKSFYAVLTLNNVVFSLSLSFFIVGPLMVYIIEVLLRRVLLNRVPGLHNKATRPSPFLSLSLGDERFLLWLTVVSTHGDSLKNCVFVKHFDVDFWFFFYLWL